jgi:hypothetical protein
MSRPRQHAPGRREVASLAGAPAGPADGGDFARQPRCEAPGARPSTIRQPVLQYGPGMDETQDLAAQALRGQMAARAHCPEAIEVIAECMRSTDERVRLMAANIMLERGYGKPKEHVDAETVHRFAVVPEVMEQELWLRTRGGTIPDPLALPPPEDPDAASPCARFTAGRLVGLSHGGS